MRAGRPETARELFYQRTTKNPSSTTLWEQWARFELLQGDAERARGLYRAALLHAEGRPRARAESLRKWGVMEFGAGEPANAVGLFERALNVLQDAEEAAAAAEEAETVEHLGTGSASSSTDASSDWSDGIGETAVDACSDLECVPRLETSESSASLRRAQSRRAVRVGAGGVARPGTSPPPTRSSRTRAPATVTTSGSCTRRLSWRRLQATSRERARSSPPRLRGTREIRTWRCRARGCSAGSWTIPTARARSSPPPPPRTPRITACFRRGRLWNRGARAAAAARWRRNLHSK